MCRGKMGCTESFGAKVGYLNFTGLCLALLRIYSAFPLNLTLKKEKETSSWEQLYRGLPSL